VPASHSTDGEDKRPFFLLLLLLFLPATVLLQLEADAVVAARAWLLFLSLHVVKVNKGEQRERAGWGGRVPTGEELLRCNGKLAFHIHT